MTHLIFTVFFIVSTFAAIVSAETLTLSTDGKTNYVIVLPAEATPVEQTAAKELKQHLDAVTGADFTIVTESKIDTAKPQIVVGNCKRVKEFLPEIDISKIPYDGIIIKSIGKNLILLGHPQRGTLYAVNTLLEDAVGIRWWTSTESFIPKKPTLEIPVQNIEYAPKLIYRDATYRDDLNGVFSARMKHNGHRGQITPEYGDYNRWQYYVHSFIHLIPPNKYFAEHPDWFSEVKGKRKHERAQLCLTNDAMREELTKNAIESLRKNPEAKFISISQNDCGGYCECKKCAEIDREEGSHSGTLLRFVNKVAEAIEQEFPDVWVETLAYQYTRKPPKFVKPRKNVIIRLCTIECSFIQPLGTGEHNKLLREDIKGWNKIADRLFIWDYVANFHAYMLPHPNLRVLASNIRFFIDHKVAGLLEQGDSYCAAGDFVRMRNWVISHLLWNPELDDKKLFDEFLNGYYGADAATFLKDYWQLLLDRAEESGVYLDCFRSSTNDWLDWETLDKVTDLINRAIEKTKDQTLRNRLRREKIPVDFVILKEHRGLCRQLELTGKSFVRLNPSLVDVNEFFARCREFNVTAISEDNHRWGIREFEQKLRQRFSPSIPPPDFCKELPKNSWFDVQNFELTTSEPRKLTFWVEDKNASNNQAVKMPNNHNSWATSYYFDYSLLDLKSATTESIKKESTYRIYVSVRCDAKTSEGIAMEFGIHDYKEKKGIASKAIPVSEISGTEYHWVDMRVTSLRPGLRFWFVPARRSNEIDAVYIDRIIVVRE
jgi:hypothetical protein